MVPNQQVSSHECTAPVAIECRSINTESRSTVVFCVWTEFGRHYRYIVNKGTGDGGGYGCEFIIVPGVRGQEESALS